MEVGDFKKPEPLTQVRVFCMAEQTIRLQPSRRRRWRQQIAFGKFQLDLVFLVEIDRHLARPSTSLPNSSSSASALRIMSWIRRAIGRAPMVGSKPFLARGLAQRVGEDRFDLLLVQLLFQLHQELVDHAQDDFLVERGEADDRVQAVAEFRREHALDVGHLVAGLLRCW